MWIKLASIAVTMVLLAGQALAIDMCFRESPSILLFVAKAYKKPSIGKCRPLTGYEASTAVPYPATGTVCLNASGTKLYVHWNTVLYTTNIEHHSSKMELSYPSLTGNTLYVRTSYLGTFSGQFLDSSAFPCVPAPLP